ncbi:MAG: DegT/DnrJ/EryC1/StrS aminotransferase family protein [Synergistaceae bacterium]|nr:DegT/DnrJ/EryC1/StrS aminotransferase family protein [Synergistaceae bacterium]
MRRDTFLPFARPSIDESTIEDVCDSLRSGWITTGPKSIRFENAFRERIGSAYALAVNSATAGLHLAQLALGIGPGDEIITTPMTFVATLNTIVLAGARPVLVDIDPGTFNLDPERLEAAVTSRTKAIVPVHFAGLPVDMDAVNEVAERHGLAVIEDCAHALGASYKGKTIGSDPRHVSVFSFHPTKNITTGEGGMVCTGMEEVAERIAVLRQHGMSKGAWSRYAANGNPHYDVALPGLKYNMMDIQAAIGLGQLSRLDAFNARRTSIVKRYKAAFSELEGLILPETPPYEHVHAWHIFTPLLDVDRLGLTRDEFMSLMRESNIGTAYHYQAVHLFDFYRKTFGYRPGDFPNAERVSERIVSLPLFPAMSDSDVEDVIQAVTSILESRLRSGGRTP